MLFDIQSNNNTSTNSSTVWSPEGAPSSTTTTTAISETSEEPRDTSVMNKKPQQQPKPLFSLMSSSSSTGPLQSQSRINSESSESQQQQQQQGTGHSRLVSLTDIFKEEASALQRPQSNQRLNRIDQLPLQQETSVVDTDSFPTLEQGAHQSLSFRSLSVPDDEPMAGVVEEEEEELLISLNAEQTATLDRVVRLAARILQFPVAVITNQGTPQVKNTQKDIRILSQHGMVEAPWSTQALCALQQPLHQGQYQQQHHHHHRNLPLLNPRGQVVGMLTLLDQQEHPNPSRECNESVEDLCFLAAQALCTSAATTRTSSSRPVGRTISPDLTSSSDTVSSSSSSSGSRRGSGLSTQVPSIANWKDDDDPSKCLIACTAHDLLTPLTAIQLSLSLLHVDKEFVQYLEQNPLHHESFCTAWQSTEVMFRMCQTTIDTLRASQGPARKEQQRVVAFGNNNKGPLADLHSKANSVLPAQQQQLETPPRQQPCLLDLGALMQSLQRLMAPIPKAVSLTMTLPFDVPGQVSLLASSQPGSSSPPFVEVASTSNNAVDWNILRCAMTVLSHACRVSTWRGGGERQHQGKAIHFRITTAESDSRLLLECEYDSPDYKQEEPSTTAASSSLSSSCALASQSVALQMESVVNGEHGLGRSSVDPSRAVFWFSVPIEPAKVSMEDIREDNIITLAPNMFGKTSSSSAPLQQVQPERPVPSPRATTSLNSRRRTFHDMTGLRGPPQAIPTLFKCQSDHNRVGKTPRTQSNGKNFQYPSAAEKLLLQPLRENALSLSFSLLQEMQFGSLQDTRAGGLDRCLQDILGCNDVLQSKLADKTSCERMRDRLSRDTTKISKESPSTMPPAKRERKALVIEDSLVIRKTVARALTKLGIEVVVQACDGVEGVQKLKEQVFDLTLCDFSMPKLGGIDCVHQYRQWEAEHAADRPRQNIVGMSAHASPNDIARGIQIGMNEYQPKPVTIQRLTELLASPPVEETRQQLDEAHGKQHHHDATSKQQLFADFTTSTHSMLSSNEAPTHHESIKRPKREGLFSLALSS